MQDFHARRKHRGGAFADGRIKAEKVKKEKPEAAPETEPTVPAAPSGGPAKSPPPSAGKHLAVKIICCVLAAVILATGVTGYLNWYDIVKMIEDGRKTETVITSLSAADPDYYASRYQYVPLKYTASQNGLASDVFGVQAVIGVDLYTDPSDTVETVKSQIDSLIAFTVAMQANTVVFELQSAYGALLAVGDYDTLSDGSPAAYAVEAAHAAGLSAAVSFCPFAWVKGGAEALLDPMLSADRAAAVSAAAAVAALGADTVILSDCRYREGQGRYADYAALGLDCGFEEYKRSCISDALYGVAAALRSSNSASVVGLCVEPIWKLASVDSEGIDASASYQDYSDGCADTKAWLGSGIFDFVQLLDFGSLTDEDAAFDTVYKWWSAAAGEAGIPVVVTHAADRTGSAQYTGWKLYDQLPRQIMAVNGDENYGGSILYTAARLRAYSETVNVITQTVKGQVDGDDILRKLVITAPKKKSTTTYNKTLNLSGSSDPNFSVTINGQTVERTSKGYFSLNFDLAIGKNTYVIEHKGSSTTYTVTREVLVFKSVAPSDTLTVYAGTPVVFTAIALRGSTVYAEIDGKKVTMTEAELQTEEVTDENSDYARFTGTYTVPDSSKTRTITGIKIHGDWEGHTDSKACANIKVKEIDKTTVRVATVINPNGAEVFRNSTVDDKSTPTAYPLPQGTQDYITGEVIYQDAEDGTIYVYYLLKSGKRVYKSKNGSDVGDVSVAAGASVAANTLGSASASVSSKYTTLKFAMSSKTPFTVALTPQSYKDAVTTDPNFTVSSFTADSVEITFNYTSAAPDLTAISGSPLFAGSASWSVSGTDCTLTLKLKNKGSFFGLYTYYEGGTLVFDFVNPPVISTASNSYGYSLAGLTIMIDPGHGGNSSGAVGANPNYPEKRINLELSLKIAEVLQSLGAKVILTRSDDTYLTLQQRVDLVNKYKPNLFISVHHNWANAVSARGVSTFYYTPFSTDLSGSIYDRIAEYYSSSMYPNGSANYKRGNMYGPYYVTRYWYCPSTLLEYGFVSNSAELQKLIDPNVQYAFARATVKGIIDYVKDCGTVGASTVTPGDTSSSTETSSQLSSVVETDEGYYDEYGNFYYWSAPASSSAASVSAASSAVSEISSQTETSSGQ